MLTPLHTAGLIRALLRRARAMAAALARNLGQLLDNADRMAPFAPAWLDDPLADAAVKAAA
jgi:hypothetical protein